MKVLGIFTLVSILAFCWGAPNKNPKKDDELLKNHEGFMAWFGLTDSDFLSMKAPKQEASREKDKVAPLPLPVSEKGTKIGDRHAHPNPYVQPANQGGHYSNRDQGPNVQTYKPSQPVLPNPSAQSNVQQKPMPAPQNLPIGPNNYPSQPSEGTSERSPQAAGISGQPIPSRFNPVRGVPNRRYPNRPYPSMLNPNRFYNQNPVQYTQPKRPNRGYTYPIFRPQNQPNLPSQSRHKMPFQGRPGQSQSQSGPNIQGPVKNKVAKKPFVPPADKKPTTRPQVEPSKHERPSGPSTQGPAKNKVDKKPSVPPADKKPVTRPKTNKRPSHGNPQLMIRPQPLPISQRPHRRPYYYRPYPMAYIPYAPYLRRPAYPPPPHNRRPESAKNGTDPRILNARCFSEGRVGKCVTVSHGCRGEVVTKAKKFPCQSSSYKCCPFEEGKTIIQHRKLPLATAFPGFKCIHSDGRVGKCLQSFFACDKGKEPSARCTDSGYMICCTSPKASN